VSTQDLRFPGSTGASLSGVLHVPDTEKAHGSVLLAHCFTCSKDIHTMTRLARGLEEAGFAVLRFDFTGLGESEGAFDETTVAHSVRDLSAAASALISRGFGPCGLFGHSLGGAASLLAAPRLHTVRSVVTLNAPSTPAHLRHLFTDADDLPGGRVGVRIGGRVMAVSQRFLDELDQHDQSGAVAELDRPLLVVHAPDDRVVGVEEGERIFAAARQPKAFHPLIGADHLVSDRGAAERLLTLVRAWFDVTL
jgi:alpha-beta hydrolase superfamily lysophospholipase